MDDSTVQKVLIPLILVITTVISGWAINQLPAIEQSRSKSLLTVKLVIETLIFAVFLNLLEDTLKFLWNATTGKPIRTLAIAFILSLLLFLVQIIYDIFQLFQRNINSNLATLDEGKVVKKSEDEGEKEVLLRSKRFRQVSALFNQNEDPTIRAINTDLNQLITPEHRKHASEWVGMRANDWIDNLQLLNYRSYGVTNANSSDFCDDLKQHLRLLQRNIEDGIGRSPSRSREKVNQSIGSPVPYKIALTDIKRLMQDELEQDEKAREWLKEEGIQALKRYMQRLIDVIDQ